MTLLELINNLEKLSTEHPEALQYPVICSGDDEGNNFTPIHFDPSIGVYDGIDFQDYAMDGERYNSVCVN